MYTSPGTHRVGVGTSVSFHSTAPSVAQSPPSVGQSMTFASSSTAKVRSNSFQPGSSYRTPMQPGESLSGGWAPATQVLKSRIISPSTTSSSDAQRVPTRLRPADQRSFLPEGGDLGPQVSRSASSTNIGRPRAAKPSLAAFASSQPDARGEHSPMKSRNSEPSVRSGMGRSYDDNDLPTLRELVKVGTAGATSSTASANRRIVGSNSSPTPTWLGMNAGQPGRFSDSQRQDVRVNEPVIALDVDEVLVQYVGGFRKYMQKERPNGPLDTDSIFHEAHSPTSPWRLQFALSGGLDNLEMVPGAAVALQKFRSAGIRLEAVTSRPPIMRQSTEALLAKLFAPDTFAAYHFVGPGEKGRTCNAIGAIALVDDQFPNCVDACSCGVTCVLFDHCGSYPWSQNLPEMPPNCKRCKTWAETCTFLLAQCGIRVGPDVQSSEYLLNVKQVVAERSAVVDYRDALSEAGKQATEYDLDLDAGAQQEVQRWVKATEQPRSESWWQMRDELPPVVQTSPTFQTAYRAQSHHQHQENKLTEETLRSEPWWQMRDEPSPVSQQTTFPYGNRMQTQPLQEYGHTRQAYQQSQTSPNLQESHPRREPLSMWNAPASTYAPEPQKAQYYGGYQPSAYPHPAVSNGLSYSTLSRASNYEVRRQASDNNANRASAEEDSMCTIT